MLKNIIDKISYFLVFIFACDCVVRVGRNYNLQFATVTLGFFSIEIIWLVQLHTLLNLGGLYYFE